MTGSARARVVALAGGCAAVAYLVALGVPWAVAGSDGTNVLPLIARSSAVSAFFSLVYLVTTPAALGFSAAAVLAPPSKGGWYVRGARLAAVLGLGGLAGVAYRLEHGDLSFGVGWYVALTAAGAAALGAFLSASEGRRKTLVPGAGGPDEPQAHGSPVSRW